MKLSRLAGLALALIVAACGSPDEKTVNSGNTNTVNPNSTPNFVANSSSGSSTDIERRLWAEICNAAFNCPNVQPELLVLVGRFASEQACVATGDFPGLDFDDGQLQASIDAGRIRWDESKANACFAALEAELCAGGGFENLPSCDEVVTGLVPAGGACASDEDCVDGFDCQTGEQCGGICAPNCGENSCVGDQICEFGTETCKAPGGVGAACDWNGDCEDALFCDDEGSCSMGGTVAAGGDCSTRKECTGTLYCIDGTCGTVELLGPGASCSFGEGSPTAVCRAGTVCTGLEVDGQQLVGTCGAPKTEGATCRLSFECAWGLGCDAETPLDMGTCSPTLPAGSACSNDGQCESFACLDGMCLGEDVDEVCEL